MQRREYWVCQSQFLNAKKDNTMTIKLNNEHNSHKVRIQSNEMQTTHSNRLTTNEMQTYSNARMKDKEMHTKNNSRIKDNEMNTTQTTNNTVNEHQATTKTPKRIKSSITIRCKSCNINLVYEKIADALKKTVENISKNETIPSVVSRDELLNQAYRQVAKDIQKLNESYNRFQNIYDKALNDSLQSCANKNNLYFQNLYSGISSYYIGQLTSEMDEVSKKHKEITGLVFNPHLSDIWTSDNVNGIVCSYFSWEEQKGLDNRCYTNNYRQDVSDRNIDSCIIKNTLKLQPEVLVDNNDFSNINFNINLDTLNSLFELCDDDGVFYVPSKIQIPQDNIFVKKGIIEKLKIAPEPLSSRKFGKYCSVWGEEINSCIQNNNLSSRNVLCDSYAINKKQLATLLCKSLGLQHSAEPVNGDQNLWRLGNYKGYQIFFSPFYNRKQENEIANIEKRVVATSKKNIVKADFDVSIGEMFTFSSDEICCEALKRFIRNKLPIKTKAKKDEILMRRLGIVVIIYEYAIGIIEKQVKATWIGADEIIAKLYEKSPKTKKCSKRTIQKDIKFICSEKFQFGQAVSTLVDALKRGFRWEDIARIAESPKIRNNYIRILNGKY